MILKMADLQPQTPDPKPVIPPSEVPVVPSIKKSNKSLFLIIGGVLLAICICTALCIAVGGTGFLKILQEREPVTEVIDSFMRAMVQKDTQKALELFSVRSQR